MKGIKEKVYHAWKTGTYPSPATKTLGIKILELSEGRSLVEMDVDEQLHNMSATMHGGVMADIADAAMGRGETRKKGRLCGSGSDESPEANRRQSQWHVALLDYLDFQISARSLPRPMTDRDRLDF